MSDPGGAGQTVHTRELELLSVVAPMLNESSTAAAFHERVCRALDGLPFELLIVDDGSTDGTAEVLDAIAAEDPRVRIVYLSRSFGHQTALTAGLDHARGNAIVMLDGDLQDPPEVIPALLDKWRQGCDVVYAVRTSRAGETRFKLATARWFYGVMGRLAQIEIQPDSGDFRLMDRRALDALLSMRERNRYLRGMTVWVGFTQTAVPYERHARFAGETKYTLRKMVRFSLDALSSFSHVPLQIATLLGFVFAAIAFLAIPLVVIARVTHVYVPGISSVLIAILLLGGIQLIAVGLIGEYLGRVYDEVKQRPLYIVREGRNLGERDVVDATDREHVSSW